MASADATDRLALLALVGDLVVAIDALQVFQIRRAIDTSTRRVEANLYAIDLEDRTVPGWDVGELLQLGATKDAWVIVDATLGQRVQRFGLRMGRCIAVQRLPKCMRVPKGVFGARSTAISSAFATTKLPEIKDWPSGVVLDLTTLLTTAEIDAGARVAGKREPGE